MSTVRLHLVFPLQNRWIECRISSSATIAEAVQMLGLSILCAYDPERGVFVDAGIPIADLHLLSGNRLFVYG